MIRWIKRLAPHTIAWSALIAFFVVAWALMKSFAPDVEARDDDEAAATEARKRPVKIVRMFPIPLDDLLTLPASVEAREDVRVSAKIAGVIQTLHCDEGQTVEAGEPLLELDIEDMRAQLRRAKSLHTISQKQFQRQQQLFEKGVGSADALDQSELAFRSAEADLDLAKVMARRGTLLSPASGFLDDVPVEAGEYIAPGDMVARIVDIDTVEIQVDIPEKDVLYFAIGDTARVEATLAFGETLATSGTIIHLARAADPASRTYPAKIAVANADHRLRPGMIVRARLLRQTKPEALMVPFFSIVDRESGKTVFIERGEKAIEIPVEIGIYRRGMIEITRGLRADDRLIVVGQRDLVNGEALRVEGDLTDLARKMIDEDADLTQLAIQAHQ